MTDDLEIPTHAAIFAQQRVLEVKFDGLIERFARHERTEEEAREERREERQEDRRDRQEIIRRLSSLEAADNRRVGRDGVWLALMRSPFAAWLTAAGVAVASFFAWMKGG